MSLYTKLVPRAMLMGSDDGPREYLPGQQDVPTCRDVLDEATSLVLALTVDRSVSKHFEPGAADRASGPIGQPSPYARRVREAIHRELGAKSSAGKHATARGCLHPHPVTDEGFSMLVRVGANESVNDAILTVWKKVLATRAAAGLPNALRADSPYVLASNNGDGRANDLDAASILAADLHLYVVDAAGQQRDLPLRRYKAAAAKGRLASPLCFVALHGASLAARAQVANLALKQRLAKTGGPLSLPPYAVVLAVPPSTGLIRHFLALEATHRTDIASQRFVELFGIWEALHALQLRCIAARNAVLTSYARALHQIHEAMCSDRGRAQVRTVAREEAEQRRAVGQAYLAESLVELAMARERLELCALAFAARDRLVVAETAARLTMAHAHVSTVVDTSRRVQSAATAEAVLRSHKSLLSAWERVVRELFDHHVTAVSRGPGAV